MADLTPYIDLRERIIDTPSAVQVDNSFIVGAVIAPNKSTLYNTQTVRSQKELLKKFNNGESVTDKSSSSLLNAYRLVKKCALCISPAISENMKLRYYTLTTNNGTRINELSISDPIPQLGDNDVLIMFSKRAFDHRKIEFHWYKRYDAEVNYLLLIKLSSPQGQLIKEWTTIYNPSRGLNDLSTLITKQELDTYELELILNESYPTITLSTGMNPQDLTIEDTSSEVSGTSTSVTQGLPFEYRYTFSTSNNTVSIVFQIIDPLTIRGIGTNVNVMVNGQHKYYANFDSNMSISCNLSPYNIGQVIYISFSIAYEAGGTSVTSGIEYLVSDSSIPKSIVPTLSERIDAFDEIYRNEMINCTMYSDLGDTQLSSYIQSCTVALRTSQGVLLRTPTFASLSGPKGYALPATSVKSASGSQWIYHFPWGFDNKIHASFVFDVSPSVLYIEAVVDARNAGHPYAGIYAHRFGIVTQAELSARVGREDRDTLLALGYNSIYKDDRPRYMHTLITSNRTCTTLNNPMNKESHRRMANKINFDAVVISEQWLGRQISDILYEEIESTLRSYIESEIQSLPENLDEYDVVCNRTNNDDMDRANNIVNIDINGKFSGEVDYINILSTYFSITPAEE